MELPADGFDWDAGNREKCQKHGLSIEDIEHVVLHNETLIVPKAARSLLELRLVAIGRVPAGRFAFVVFTPREKGGKLLIRPVSARYMHRKEIEKYEEEISRSHDR